MIEFVNIAILSCGYREPAPEDPINSGPDDPNWLRYGEGSFGHDYTLTTKCPGCNNKNHAPKYPYAEKGIRLVIRK